MDKGDITFAVLILGGIGSWTTVIVVCTIWLTAQFRKLERVIYHEIGFVDTRIEDLTRRLDRLEINAFGFNFPGSALPTRPKQTE